MQTEKKTKSDEVPVDGFWEPTVGVDQRPKCVEEPPVTIELLLVLLLQAEEDLNWASTRRHLSGVGYYDLGGESKAFVRISKGFSTNRATNSKM